MCYYSKTLHHSQFRDAKVGEDLTLQSDNWGHHYPMGSDGKVVCMLPGTELHIEKLELHYEHAAQARREFPMIENYLGKPLDTHFVERNTAGYSADRIWVGGYCIHLAYLRVGMKFYTGAKRVPMETKLGVDDPSIALDHKVDETPTLARTVGRALGLCSIVR